MSFSCSQCSFIAQFESALTMHHQLYHEPHIDRSFKTRSNILPNTLPRISRRPADSSKEKDLRLPARTSSATLLFEKLRARIRRSKALFAHHEESGDECNDIMGHSVVTSNSTRELTPTFSSVNGIKESLKEVFSCHLCSFDADRITALDRHLLNDHKISLDKLLKLVMAKTKDGLMDDVPIQRNGVRQPYYRSVDMNTEGGEFIIETTTPQIKILKHASVNTDLKYTDIPDLNDDCKLMTHEIEKLIDMPRDKCDKNTLLAKMQTLNEYMCKFANSSNTLKNVLNKELVQKKSLNRSNESFISFGLGDQTPRSWKQTNSEGVVRIPRKTSQKRNSKSKLSAESFYF
ncbi:uncharacterized protein LOC126971437 [Leptidea sinapis]|uniref:uncharacterized protein LOC126971437 n=1 Tax=Leptidea sinapis TaxID=189913 RepID=UPI00212479A8|nr:uncharacterized protein LOC126971437 [Leptidea sinapis]